MDMESVVKGTIAGILLLANAAMIWFSYVVFGLLIASETLGATIGFAILFILLCVGGVYLFILSSVIVLVWLD